VLAYTLKNIKVCSAAENLLTFMPPSPYKLLLDLGTKHIIIPLIFMT